jgi:predicted nucleotidyltransferase
MSAQMESLLDEIVEEMKTIFKGNLVSVILFGSYARGDFDSESDVDVMVVTNIPNGEISQFREIVDRTASRISLENDNCTTVCIMLQDLVTFNKHKNYLPFLKNVVNEGVTLYVA